VFEKRIVGIDYGRKRIGLARSDPLRMTAQPLETVTAESPKGLFQKLLAVLATMEIELLIIGLPKSLSGGGGAMAEEVTKFAENLQKEGYKVELVDERLSSKEVEKMMRMAGKSERDSRGKIDTVVAQLLLQTYLDRTGGSGQ